MEIQAFTPSPFASTGFQSGTGFSISNRQVSAETRELSETFGREMLRRVETGATGDQEKLGAAEGSSEKLATAMADSVEFVRSSYGDQAANAFMATMLRDVGEQGITEQSFGKAMLNSVRLIDSQYGFAEGDKLIRNLNDNLNEAVNDYFDNGFNEQIYAFSPGSNPIKLAMDSAVSGIAAKFGEEEAQSVMDMLMASIKESESMSEGLRDGLKDVQAYLDEKYGLEAAAESLSMPPLPGDSQSPPPKGTLLNSTV